MAAGLTGMPTRSAVRSPLTWAAGLILCLLGGCINQPGLLSPTARKPFDRSAVEYPSGFVLRPLLRGLNQPTAICFDADRNDLLVAESGIDGSEPHLFGYHLGPGPDDGKYFSLYPAKRTVSFFPTGFVIYGPVGGMVVHHGRVYVSHRDRDGRGVITAFGYDGSHTTIVANLPAQGDYGVTDLCVKQGRLYFGIGTATNSGVVGLDNYDAGWLRHHPDVHDQFYSFENPPRPLVSNGARFDTPNPRAGLGQPDIVVTTPFQPFGHGSQSRIRPAAIPNGAVCSVPLDDGGDIQVLTTGLHDPRGLAVDEYSHIWATNDGMQLRGTRPILDDPDVLIDLVNNGYMGWPDVSTDGRNVTELPPPPISMLLPSGYSEVTALINAAASGLHVAPFKLAARFPSLSGAAKLAFVPATGPFAKFADSAVVALDGDRAPYASGGLKLLGFQGGKLVLVNLSDHRTRDFVFNTAGLPASRQPYGTVALERPCDVKFNPRDGVLYVLDFGQMENDTAVPHYHDGTGAVYTLEPAKP